MSETLNQDNKQNFREWKGYEKNLFRFFFIFLVIQIIPLDWKFYQKLFSINWLHLHFHDLFELTKYQPQFFADDQTAKWYGGTFANWGLFALIAAIGAAIWSRIDAARKEYTVLYYWLR
ncbi:MAG TPA: hypothetical protein VK541_14870, partial [Pedobacter sp.]|nr:hypothetical protein [Pedobacter sp.]